MKSKDIYSVTSTNENDTKLSIIHDPDKSPTLEQAQDFCGGHIVMAPIYNEVYAKRKNQLLVNEEGELLKLKPNSSASMIAGYTIYGNAIMLAGEARWD